MKTKSQLDTPMHCHPATVEAWSDFSNQVASHVANLDGSRQSYSPIVLPVTKVKILAQACYCCWASAEVHSMFAADFPRESAVVFTWHSVVKETMNRVLHQDGSALQWQPDYGDLPTDSIVCICSVHKATCITSMFAV